MDKELENLDSQNQETDEASEVLEAEPDENADSENGEPSDNSDNSKKESPEYSDREKKLFARAKGNEDAAKTLKELGFERKNGKWVKPSSPSESSKSQSSEPDYARLSFLETRGVVHADDQQVVLDEAARLKLPLTDILSMAHIQSKLATAKEQREALEGMPKGRGRAGGKGIDTIEYHIAKGTLPDDPDEANKVIEAKMQKASKANKFSDDLYIG